MDGGQQSARRWAKTAEGKQALERQRHLFLRNQEDLSAEDEQSRALLAAAFPEIERAWQLKEALLRQGFGYANRRHLRLRLLWEVAA